MSPLHRILDRVPEPRRRIVLPEATEPRVLEAAARLAAAGKIEPILVGHRGAVEAEARRLGIDATPLRIEDPAGHPNRGDYLAAMQEAFRGRNVQRHELDELLEDPVHFAAAMVRAGDADGSVSGSVHTTADTIRVALRVLGPAPGAKIVSSFFLMGLREPSPAGDDVLAFADCGLVPYPTAEELSDIAWRTALHYRRLIETDPRVAFLSFSTWKSANHQAADRVREAKDRLLAMKPDFQVDGELQADAALVPDVAASKAPGSAVAGRANVLIFPNLDAGNIAYKLVERLAGAQAVGPILQGLSRPANDVSRACSADDIVLAAAVTALQS